MRKVINFAIVGYGSVAKTHLMATQYINTFMNLLYELRLKYIVTRREMEPPYNYTICTQDIERVIKDSSIDFVYVCTPNQDHMVYVKRLIEEKIPVYCEKPLTEDLRHSEDMVEMIKESGTPFGVALVYRFVPSINMMKRLLEENKFGDVIRFKVKFYHKSYLDEGRVGSWKTKRSCGKGAALDLGVHAFDLVQYVFGEIEDSEMVEDIYFKDRNETDEIAFADLILRSGVKGSCEMSRIYGDLDDMDSIEAYTTMGKLRAETSNPYVLEMYDHESQTKKLIKPGKDEDFMKYYPKENTHVGAFTANHAAGIVSFVNMIEGMDCPIKSPSAYDSLSSERVIWK